MIWALKFQCLGSAVMLTRCTLEPLPKTTKFRGRADLYGWEHAATLGYVVLFNKVGNLRVEGSWMGVE